MRIDVHRSVRREFGLARPRADCQFYLLRRNTEHAQFIRRDLQSLSVRTEFQHDLVRVPAEYLAEVCQYFQPALAVQNLQALQQTVHVQLAQKFLHPFRRTVRFRTALRKQGHEFFQLAFRHLRRHTEKLHVQLALLIAKFPFRLAPVFRAYPQHDVRLEPVRKIYVPAHSKAQLRPAEQYRQFASKSRAPALDNALCRRQQFGHQAK